MKSASPALISLLNSGQFVSAMMWTITLNGGTVLRYTSADKQLVYGGLQYTVGPVFECDSIVEKIGIEVATLDMVIKANESNLINSVPMIKFISRRGLRGARVRLDKAFMADWNSPIVGLVNRFIGRVTSTPEIMNGTAHISVSSETILLNTKYPPDVYQSGCLRTVYDSGCGLDPASWKVTGNVTVGGDGQMTVGISNASGYFNQGTIKFLTGPNAGVSRSVKTSTLTSGANVVTLVYPLPVSCTVGDQVELLPGCDLSKSTCINKFNNANRFRGYPYVPIPETVV